MELSPDLIAIQGILSSKLKQIGEFTKINYRGGNEDKILDIMVEIQKYLMGKNYIKKGKINSAFSKELEEIVLFLAINTVYKKPLEIEEYSHLMNIIPPFSKCLFANVVYGLDLCLYFALTIEKLPLEIGSELLDEAIQCLKKSVPKVHLEYASMFLKSAARKLGSTAYSLNIEDEIDNFTQVTSIMLLNLTGIYSDQTEHMKELQIYQHMGYCLLNLFDVLLMCDNKNASTQKFIQNVIRTCCSIVRSVTINVYCAWAEIEEDEENLQRLVSEKAYLIIQSYHKSNGASELISMLGEIAKKPLSITELIQKSNATTIIKMINKKDTNQEKWFRALFTTQVLRNKEALECIKKWSHLCNEEDVILLLNLTIQTNSEQFRELVIKCATSLSLDKLMIVCTRHFYRNNFSHNLCENIGPSLTLMFNKLNDKQFLSDDIEKEFVLLLLQNPVFFLNYIITECTKNKFYTDIMISTFQRLKEISTIDSIGVNTLKEVLNNNISNSPNILCYAYLFRKLYDIEYLTTDDMVLKIFLPIITQQHKEKNLEGLLNVLEILKHTDISVPVRSQYEDFLKICLQLLKYRCKFLNFDSLHQDVVARVVDIFYDLCDINMNSDFQVTDICNAEDSYMEYYSRYISSDMNTPFLLSICPKFDINNHGSSVSQILQILPSAVTREWLTLSNEMIKAHGKTKLLEILTDVIILLAQLVETQDINENKTIYLALSYCLNNFGIVIKKNVQNESTNEIEHMVATQICRVIAKLPEGLKEKEGLLLINVLNAEYLKSLAKDKEFLCLVILIKNPQVCKALVEKMK